MKWKMKIQKLGRIQIPSKYLSAYEIKEGDMVIIQEKDKKLILTFKKLRAKEDKKEEIIRFKSKKNKLR